MHGWLGESGAGGFEDNAPLAAERLAALVDELRESPIAKETDAANEQHYEVPAEFFHLHLGPRLKYSCAWYETGRETLAEAEEAMFKLYAERAGLAAPAALRRERVVVAAGVAVVVAAATAASPARTRLRPLPRPPAPAASSTSSASSASSS